MWSTNKAILPETLPAERPAAAVSVKSRKSILNGVIFMVLALGAVTMILPFIWMISVSFRTQAMQFSRSLIPNPFTIQNYIELWDKLPDKAFPYLIFNSFKLSILTTIGQILTCAMAAFSNCGATGSKTMTLP
jgi:ABC-type glycerol-3-phosphate transport system permease component